MRLTIRICLLAMAAALMITLWARPKPLDDQLLALQVQQLTPHYREEVLALPAELQAMMLAYSDDSILLAKAQIALERYPGIAPPVFLTFGMSPDFQDVLKRYGEDVILPIHYFVEHEVFTLELMRSMSETARTVLGALRSWWHDDEGPGGQREGALNPEERGWYAIQFIDAEGYGLLAQFVMTPDGKVAWLQTERVLDALNQFFAGGISRLETRWRQDREVGAGDVAWAAVDVAVGVGAFKLLRMSRVPAVAGRPLSLSQRSAVLGAGLWRGSVVGVRVAKYGAPAILAYVALRHPSVINSLLGSLAAKLGVPVPVAQWLGWTILLVPVIFVFQLLLGPIARLLSGIAWMLRRSHKALAKG